MRKLIFTLRNNRGELSILLALGALGLMTLATIAVNLTQKRSQNLNSNAQTSCVNTLNVSSDRLIVAGLDFYCHVQVDPNVPQPRNIACGLSSSSQWPRDVCRRFKSDGSPTGYGFSGYTTNNTAVFKCNTNCIRNDTCSSDPSFPAGTYQLVGFDNNPPSCTPSNGKWSTPFFINGYTAPTPTTPPGYPTNTPFPGTTVYPTITYTLPTLIPTYTPIPPSPTLSPTPIPPAAYVGGQLCPNGEYERIIQKEINDIPLTPNEKIFLSVCPNVCRVPRAGVCLGWIPTNPTSGVGGPGNQVSPTIYPTITISLPSPTLPVVPTLPGGKVGTSIVYYSQCNPSWTNYPPAYMYCDGMDIPTPQPNIPTPTSPVSLYLKNAGCGPSNIAMILATDTKDSSSYTPKDRWDELQNKGRLRCIKTATGINKGTSGSDIRAVLEEHGFKTEYKPIADESDQKSVYKDMYGYLQAGNYIIGYTNLYSGAHYLIVTRIETDGQDNYTVYVNDSYLNCAGPSPKPATGESVLTSGTKFIIGYSTIKKG